ncbi:MAG TPA: AMP-binding protein, partial [Longilinea sp.]|nr:AMP-binding protein [Longilinea sp.]
MSERPWLKKYDPDVPHDFAMPEVPLSFFLKQSAYHFPDRPALILGDCSITYRDLETAVDRLAMALRGNGLKEGEPVVLALPNIPQFILAYYAILKAGGVVTALNPHHRQSEMIAQVNQLSQRWLIGEFESYGMLKAVRAATSLEHVVVTQLEDARKLAGNKKPMDLPIPLQDGDYYLLELLGQGWDEPLPVISAECPAIYQFSGGTTGTPKAAIGLHRNLVANTLQFRSWLSGMHEGQEVVCAAIPLFHVYGMVIAMSLGIALGATLVLIPNGRNTQEVLDAIQKHKATLFPGVPSMYQAINQHPDVQAGHYDLRSIKACISGSAPLPQPVKEQFEQFTGGKLLEGYGLSEAPTATHCNPMYGENRSGSIGLPLPGVECRIVDPETGEKEVSQGMPGEMIIHGPQVMHSYLNDPIET